MSGLPDRMTTAVPYQPPLRHFQPQVSAPQPMLANDMPGGISGFQRLGYGAPLLFLFLIYSRLFDVRFGFLHIPGISYRLILVMMVLGRAFLPALKHPIGR